jgi:hypothetical protein
LFHSVIDASLPFTGEEVFSTGKDSPVKEDWFTNKSLALKSRTRENRQRSFKTEKIKKRIHRTTFENMFSKQKNQNAQLQEAS